MSSVPTQKTYRAIGLMSGTSLDGIDVALIETDGVSHVKPIAFSYFSYDEGLRAQIRACFGARVKTPATADAEHALTMAHVRAVKDFMAAHNLTKKDVDLIGFHGQTITHDPANMFTWQLGDGELLARETGIDVVYDFRTADVAAGGQGAPLIPIYHWARMQSSGVPTPVAILNIGGVSNVTWLGQADGDVLAFDCGAGNALIDDVVLKATGARFDTDGKLAKSGKVDEPKLREWLSHPYFKTLPPKSLDRDAWNTRMDDAMPLADKVATLTAFTVGAIVKAADHFPASAKLWYVAGGGRLNGAIMDGLRMSLNAPVHAVDALGWNGDAVEAEGFAYLAVRSVRGLPLSFPTTTGCPAPISGGKIVKN